MKLKPVSEPILLSLWPFQRASGFMLSVLVMLVVMIGGCSSMRTNRFLEETNRPVDAGRFFSRLDAEVENAGVRHMAYARIEGFPYLRVSRYLVALKDRLDSPDRKKNWLLAMQTLDLEAREKEIRNLPESALKRLTGAGRLEKPDLNRELMDMAKQFSSLLLNQDLKTETLYTTLVEAVEVPDDYSLAMRTFGLYPIVMPVVAYFTDGAYDKMRERNQTPTDELVVHGELTGYVSPQYPGNKPADILRMYQQADRDAFGLPLLSEEDKQQIVRVFAPEFVHDVADTFDLPGEVSWETNRLIIDGARPTVYYYFTPSLFQGKPIWQINYVTWTAGRLGPNAPSIEKGELDGITLRISLDDMGEPIIVDGMNNCGCYHFSVPNQERLQRIKPISWEFDAVVVDHLPPDFPEKPIGIRVTSGWHQVEDVGTALVSEKRETYQLLPYHLLESLPRGSGEAASMFDDEGVGIGSDRIEIYIFFSMGIPRVGAMRQRGHHPTKLVGRAHFDDPYLLDKNFEFK